MLFLYELNSIMIKLTRYFLLLLLCIGCKKEHTLTFDSFKLDHTSCDTCPSIKIDIPNALDNTKIAQNINTALDEELIYLLNFDETANVQSVQDAIESFIVSYQNIQQKFGEETIGWEAEIIGEVVYEDNNIITIKLNSYTFTGGAHGHGATTYLNFEKPNGTELENHQLFKDYENFEVLAEKMFRKKEGIPQKEGINSTGFMFSGDTFHLSNNIGYTKEGIQLVYNQYEVASYADGPVVLVIPFEKANEHLQYSLQL